MPIVILLVAPQWYGVSRLFSEGQRATVEFGRIDIHGITLVKTVDDDSLTPTRREVGALFPRVLQKIAFVLVKYAFSMKNCILS